MDSDPLASCPFCDSHVPLSQLTWHANTHFSDLDDIDFDLSPVIHPAPDSPPRSLPREHAANSSRSGANSSCGGEASSDTGECKVNDKISFLIDSQTRSKFYKVEAGLMALLRNCLESEVGNSNSILSGYVDHFQCLESEDAGWGCGWRNIQMLSSHLLVQRPEARKALFGGSGFVPDILSLQRWLEIAWEKGFDAPGSAQFNHVICGSKKWIGTTECAALLRSFALRARVVDFGPKESQSVPGSSIDNTRNKASIHNRVKRKAKNGDGYQVLMDFVWNYFSDKSSIQFGQQHVVISEKTPLYFQHDGHSRTIVGIQVNHQQKRHLQYNLLVLDPAHSTVALEGSLRQKVGWEKLVKRGMHTLKKPQYQLCYVDPGIASEEEMGKLKTIHSVFLEF
ncbi:zinc finger-containing ubiquitin peptidase 1 [Cajanus cajan]|nr:zinc finger-containing ubiquitin peptidase 1 [Cajanus cajan]XP_029129542.1 zinc finger-containing ubiquitin peptidase 1 [Cajanus cajan]XP_029129543.1 zinc finger-containing ubiquitin peptidase 1 [Cajanus cajan]XP_029129544.1 zinc finger-containing ubiquitin peptidase 1 [Cajanus cajan]